jgi:hypothetical protein
VQLCGVCSLVSYDAPHQHDRLSHLGGCPFPGFGNLIGGLGFDFGITILID